MSSLFGKNPKSCGHEDRMPKSSICFVTPDETEDFKFITEHLGLKNPEKVTSVRVCDDCRDLLPSTVARLEEQRRTSRLRREAEAEEKAEVIERVRGGETLYHCESCDSNFPEDELVQVRECPQCETTFDGSGNGRNCPDCNRPFSRKLADQGCPDCLEENELEPVDLDDLIKQALEGYAFEIDGEAVKGEDLAGDPTLTSDDRAAVYDLEVDGRFRIGGAPGRLIEVYRRAKG